MRSPPQNIVVYFYFNIGRIRMTNAKVDGNNVIYFTVSKRTGLQTCFSNESYNETINTKER
jgi:hypothetical protein